MNKFAEGLGGDCKGAQHTIMGVPHASLNIPPMVYSKGVLCTFRDVKKGVEFYQKNGCLYSLDWTGLLD